MLALGVGVVVGRIIVQEFDVCHKRSARVETFKEVVAEQRVFGNAVSQRHLEGVNIVETFARVAAFTEEVLINVGDGGRVRINARVAGEDTRKQRARGARQRDADARLQNRVAFRDAPLLFVVARAIERVRDRADETTRHIARQLRVGIERDDVANIGEKFPICRHDDKARVARTA